MKLPRGIRNKNPGNIRWGSNWQGLILPDERTDEDFCQFKQPLYGLRAIVKIMITYRNKYHLNTIESIIDRYAPPIENNTNAYINRVCEALKVSPDEPIELTEQTLVELVRAIIAVENGNLYYHYYPELLIKRAIQNAQRQE